MQNQLATGIIFNTKSDFFYKIYAIFAIENNIK